MLLLAEQNRTFGYAVAASIALHALLLATKAPMHPVPPAPPEPPLVAHLVEPAPPPPAPPPPLERPPEPRKLAQPAPKPEPQRKPKPRPIPKPKPRLQPAPVARANPPVAAPPPPAPPPSLPEPAAKAAAVEPEVAPAPVVTAAPRPDPAVALAQFRSQLVELAKRYKRYPPRAADNGWTGDVLVRVDVAASGKIEAVRVQKSSGFEVLDAQALEMFHRAAPEVALPAALRGKPFSVDVRAIYNLSDRPG